MSSNTFAQITVTNEFFFPKYNTTFSNLFEKTLAFTRNSEFHITYLASDDLQVTRKITSLTSIHAPLITTNNILLNGVPLENLESSIEGITILVSGNQTTFQRDGTSSSIQFRVYDDNNAPRNLLFNGATPIFPARVLIPCRLQMHSPIGSERNIFTSYLNFIDTINIDEIQRARHHAIGNGYFIENMRDGGIIYLQARKGPHPGGAGSNTGDMITMFQSRWNEIKIFPNTNTNTTDLCTMEIGTGTHILQNAPLGPNVTENILRRTTIRRILDDYSAGSGNAAFAVLDGGDNRGMYINPNSTGGYINTFVQLNDVVMGALGPSNANTTKNMTFTVWASIPLGVRISLLNTAETITGSVTLRAGDTQIINHSAHGWFFHATSGFLNTGRPIRFNSILQTNRKIENLTTLSFSNDTHDSDTILEDMDFRIVNSANAATFRSFRDNMIYIFQTRGVGSETLANRFVISHGLVTVHRVNFRVLSNPVSFQQRQMILRVDDNGNHYIQCANIDSTSGGNVTNNLIIALGGVVSGTYTDTAVFTFRRGENTRHESAREIRLPGLQFTGDAANVTQTTAFSSSWQTQIMNANILAEDAIDTSINAQQSLNNIGGITRWGSGFEGQISNSTSTFQTLSQHSLPAGTYIISYTSHLYTKQNGSRTIKQWTTWLADYNDENLTIEVASSRINQRNFTLPPVDASDTPLKQYFRSHTQHGSMTLTLASTTTIRFLVWLIYEDVNEWNSDVAGGTWSYTRNFFTATRIK